MTGLTKAIACLLLTGPALAQPQAFTRTAIKPAPPSESGMRMRVLPNGDLIADSVPVVMLLSYAYEIPVNPSARLSSLPDWAIRERFDIYGKAPANVIPGLPDYPTRGIRQMIRGLLGDRFGLLMRVERKRLPVYVLAVRSGGTKLSEAPLDAKGCILDTDPEGCHSFLPGFGHPLKGRAVDMDDLAHYIENWTDLPVENRTGLRDLFSVNTEGWRPMRLPPPPPTTSPATDPFASLPSIFAVLDRLGLKLDRQEDVLPVYTVERIEHPSRDRRRRVSGIG